MGIGVKLAAAGAALLMLSSPSATSTVLGQAHGAFTAFRSELSAELAGGGATQAMPSSDSADAMPSRAASGAHSYRFTVQDGMGRPGRWNPCSSVPIIVNLAGAPTGALADLRSALANVDRASGLRFYIAGTTTARPTSSWGEQAWSGNPNGWPPVLVAFASPGTGPLSDNGESGVTTPVWIGSGSHEVFVSGQIVFNSAQSRMYLAGFGAGLHRGVLFEHELGHLAGLDHVNDPRQVMYPEIGHAAGLGAGDMAGLRALGAGGCLTVPTPYWAG